MLELEEKIQGGNGEEIEGYFCAGDYAKINIFIEDTQYQTREKGYMRAVDQLDQIIKRYYKQ